MKFADIVIGTRLWNSAHKVWGTVSNRPQPRGDHIRLVLEGNTSPAYYHRKDLFFDASGAEPVGVDVAPPITLPPPHAPLPAETNGSARVEHRLDTAIRNAAVPEYGGDLTLARLEERLILLKNGVAGLETKIWEIRTRELLRSELGKLGFRGDVSDRAALAAEAIKLGASIRKATADATR